jgi:hypothetical protein
MDYAGHIPTYTEPDIYVPEVEDIPEENFEKTLAWLNGNPYTHSVQSFDYDTPDILED